MKTLLKKRSILLAIPFLYNTAAYSQKEFFRSKQSFTQEQLSNSYSSITIHDDLVIFNANDYHLYAYNKVDGSMKWSVKTSYKTSVPVFVQGSVFYAGISMDEKQQAAQFNLVDGRLIKALPFGPLATRPFTKNNILYGTAIHNYGCIVAYDLQKDTVAWSRFIAHGFSRQPYYLDKEIMANTEGNNWVQLGYNGVLLDTTCATKPAMYVEDIPCVKTFAALTHDGLEIKGKLSDKIFGEEFFEQPDIITTKSFTYILNGDKLSVISKKLNLMHQVDLSGLAEELGDNRNNKLLKADQENAWVLCDDKLIQYDHKVKKLVRLTDLSAWQPRQVVIDEDNIWLVSGKDGLLYGLSF
jgi:PQQ enzyme repeat